MPKLKRTSENQLNKDIYDAGDSDRFGEQPDPGRGMTRASQDVMQRRKIIKVSRRKFGGGTGSAGALPAPTAPPAAAPAPAASSNPFASTTLAQPNKSVPTSLAPPKMGGADAPPKANPFANVAFASSSAAPTTAAAAPTFSFAPSAKPPPASKPAAPAFSFASSSASSSQPTTVMTTPKSSVSTQAKQSTSSITGGGGKIQELNEMFLSTIVDHWEGHHRTDDYSTFMKEYLDYSTKLEAKLAESDEGTNGNDMPPPGPDNSSAPAPDSSAPAPTGGPATSFSFGGASKAPFSFGAPAPAPSTGGSTFSFAAKPAATDPSTAAPPALSYSFGGTAAKPAFASATPAANSNNTNDDDPTSNPDDGKIDTVERENNKDEEILHEVRARHMKKEDNAWKKFGVGTLRLSKNKITGKHKMVIRNEIGKVQFNVGVPKGMTFSKVIKDGKKGKSAFVKFMAMEDQEKGLETFMIQVKPESVDELHEKMNGMAA